MPGPDRRGRRERLQVRVVVEQRGQHRHHPRPLRHADVHVQAPDQHLPAPPLGAVDQLLVAVPLGELLRGPRRERVRARAEQVDAQLVGRTGTTTASVSRRSVIASLDRLADAGDDLDGVAEQLLVQPARVGQPGLGPREQVRRRRCAGRGYAVSTSANSHSTPSVGRAEAWKSMRTPPSERTRRSTRRGRESRPGVGSMAAMLEARDAQPRPWTSASGSASCCSPPGAGAADVTATMRSLSWPLGAPQPRDRRDLHGAVDELPAGAPRSRSSLQSGTSRSATSTTRTSPWSTTWSATCCASEIDLAEARADAGPDHLLRPRPAALGGHPRLGRDVRRRRPDARRQRAGGGDRGRRGGAASTGSRW